MQNQTLTITTFVLLSMAGAPVTAAGGEPVAHVIRMSAPCSTSFEVHNAASTGGERSEAKRRCPISYYTSFQNGDQIIIGAPEDWLELHFSDGRTQRVTWENSPFDVEGGRTLSTAFNKLLGSVFALLAPSPSGSISTHSAVARGEAGGPLDVPMLDSSLSMKLAAGPRRFALEWDGGVPPFRVELARNGQVELVGNWSEIGEQGLEPQPIDLAQGGHEIMIRDSKGKRKRMALEVVDAAAMPRLPLDERSGGRDGDISEFAEIAWLAGQDEAWRLESYIRATALAERYPAAKLLADHLADGRLIPLTAP